MEQTSRSEVLADKIKLTYESKTDIPETKGKLKGREAHAEEVYSDKKMNEIILN
mgnify:FL=1